MSPTQTVQLTANCGLSTNVYLFAAVFAYCVSNFLCEIPANIWNSQTWAVSSSSVCDQIAALCRSDPTFKCLYTSVPFGQYYVKISCCLFLRSCFDSRSVISNASHVQYNISLLQNHNQWLFVYCAKYFYVI